MKGVLVRRKRCLFMGILAAVAVLAYQLVNSKDTAAVDSIRPSAEIVPVEQLKPVEKSPAVKPASPPIAKQTSEPENHENPEALLAELIPTEEQSRILYEAEEAAVAKCMNERGFEYEPNSYESTADRKPWEVSLKSGDLETAGEVGYGIAASLEMDRMPIPESENDQKFAAMSPEAQQAWADAFAGPMIEDPTKIPDSGTWVSLEHPSGAVLVWDSSSCLSAARQSVYGDEVEQMHNEFSENELRDQVADLIEKDTAYVQSMDDWRTCMSEAGYEYENPSAATNSLQEQYNAGKLDIAALQTREIEIAKADAKCHQSSRMDNAFAAAKQRAESSVRAEHGDRLAKLQKSLASSLDRAQKQLPDEE